MTYIYHEMIATVSLVNIHHPRYKRKKQCSHHNNNYHRMVIVWVKECVHCWWECKLVQPLWKTVWRFLKNLKIELLYDQAIPVLGIYLDKILIQKDTCTPMFTAALFTIAKIWKQPKCLLTDEWIKKMWYIYI